LNKGLRQLYSQHIGRHPMLSVEMSNSTSSGKKACVVVISHSVSSTNSGLRSAFVTLYPAMSVFRGKGMVFFALARRRSCSRDGHVCLVCAELDLFLEREGVNKE
jgi:hypothetical protein